MAAVDPASFHGIYASTICPMLPDGRVAEGELTRHIVDVMACDGLAGLLINGHAGENALLTRDESRKVVAIARQAAPKTLIVAGVNAENTEHAVAIARDAAAAGADAIMAFPPFSWALGIDPRAAVAHHRAIHDATDLPLMLFQGSVNSGRLAFELDLLEELIGLRRVVAIKEGSWETSAYEATRNLVRRVRPEVAVMASGDEHLFPCLAIGSDGSLVSLAAIVPELIVALDRAVRIGRLDEARAIHERIYPLSKEIYAVAPAGLVSARIKQCLVLLGRQNSAACKGPIGALTAVESARLEAALQLAGLEPHRSGHTLVET